MLRNPHVMAAGWQFGPPLPLKMVAESITIPKEGSYYPRGDYASFFFADKQFIGVADGEYARQLMSLVVKKSRKEFLEEAYSSKTTAATACIVSFSGEECVLRAANVGDSGFLVIRNGVVLYRSPKQQRVAEEFELRGVEKGDLVLLGKDGVLDNVVHESSEILEFLARPSCLDGDLREMCSFVANLAIYNSFVNRSIPDTPYSPEAEWNGEERAKREEITLVIARIE